MVMFHQQITHIHLISLCFPFKNAIKIIALSIFISLPYFRAGIFGLTKTSPEIVWFKYQMLIVPTLSFSTLAILVTTS